MVSPVASDPAAPALPILPKPPHGGACNGCGGCCQAELCPLAVILYPVGTQAPCPALQRGEDGRMVCGVVVAPAAHARALVRRHGTHATSEAAALAIGSGMGCDAQAEGEPANEAWRAQASASRHGMWPRITAALRMLGFATPLAGERMASYYGHGLDLLAPDERAD